MTKDFGTFTEATDPVVPKVVTPDPKDNPISDNDFDDIMELLNRSKKRNF